MRRIYFPWILLVFGLVGTIYGSYLLVYHFTHGNGLNVLALFLLILGGAALILMGSLYLYDYINKKKKQKNIIETTVVEEKPKEITPVPEKEEKPEPKHEAKEEPKKSDVIYESRPRQSYSSSSYSYSTVYVKQVGCGPVLRVEGSRIIDMRDNTYYRIENNNIMQDGYGIRFEIRGNQIRDAFGGYLYEINGSNINKVFGGFYASISGNYITLFDLSQKYEMTDSLSKKQLLVVAALLFGRY